MVRGAGIYCVAFDTGPIATKNQIPCQALVVRRTTCDGAERRVAGQRTQFVPRLRRVGACGAAENARAILKGDDHRQSMAKQRL